MKVVTHNVWVGQEPEEIRSHLVELAEETEGPAGIFLQEARRFNGSIPGYRRIAEDDTREQEDSNSVLLVRHDLEVMHEHYVRVKGPHWVGPKQGKSHPPKVHVGATVRHQDQPWVLLDVHRIPNDLRNPLAVDLEWLALRRWASHRTEGRPLAMIGDWNARHVDLDLREFAAHIDAEIHLRGIDGALTRNCTVTRVRELKGLYGSDAHHPLVITLEAR